MTTRCGDSCTAPNCICDHPDDCACGCGEDLTVDDPDWDDEDDGYCDDLACPCHDDGGPCPDSCNCAWCTDPPNDTPGITTLQPLPAYLWQDNTCPLEAPW